MSESQDLRCILNPTDFSQGSVSAFTHALRIALANRSHLHLLHVEGPHEHTEAVRFPRVRELLVQWKIIPPDARRSEIQAHAGIEVKKAVIDAFSAAAGIGSYARRHDCDLLVMTTHDPSRLRRWTGGSVSEAAAQASRAPALFLRDGQRGFVNPSDGQASLARIVLPVDGKIPASGALRLATDLARSLGSEPRIIPLHIGSKAPRRDLGLSGLVLRDGPVEGTIVDFAKEIDADLIVMPTEGRHGLFDALFGSTTERVVHEAPCPVLAVP